MHVLQTSAHAIGQIYIPGVNVVLLLLVLGAVVGFGSSSRLASAYGVAVTGTMLVTTILTFFVIRYGWGYNLILSLGATAFFVFIDSAFFASSLLKIAEGGWFPLVLGLFVFTLMTTWRRGREIARERLRVASVSLDSFVKSLETYPLSRVPGTGIFMAGNPDVVPSALLHNLAHNKVLHERVVLLTVRTGDVPWVPASQRIAIEALGSGFYRVRVNFGFMDEPDVSEALELCKPLGLSFEPLESSFLLSRASVIAMPGGPGMALWRDHLFATMARNARTAADYFNLPVNRVIELGTRVEI